MSNRQKTFQQAIIHFQTKLVTITTVTLHEKWHIPPAQKPQSICTKNVRQNKAKHQEGANNSRAKWKTIPRQDNDKHGNTSH